MKKDFVRIQVRGKKYRWYYKKFMKRMVMLALLVLLTYFMLDITLKAWDIELERQKRLVEEHLRRIENSFDPEMYYKEGGGK